MMEINLYARVLPHVAAARSATSPMTDRAGAHRQHREPASRGHPKPDFGRHVANSPASFPRQRSSHGDEASSRLELVTTPACITCNAIAGRAHPGSRATIGKPSACMGRQPIRSRIYLT